MLSSQIAKFKVKISGQTTLVLSSLLSRSPLSILISIFLIPKLYKLMIFQGNASQDADMRRQLHHRQGEDLHGPG
jgi:hypothetical protein